MKPLLTWAIFVALAIFCLQTFGCTKRPVQVGVDTAESA